MKIVFMGTPAFAVPVLKKLVDSGHNIVAVYTKPPQPAGRGKKELKSPIHIVAEEYGIPVKCPRSLKGSEDIEQFRKLGADIAVVAAYGLILREPILQAPQYGCINIHPSSLPRWRGAAPIQHTIMSGDMSTSVCIMQMDEGLDTGDVLERREVLLDEQITFQELHDKLADMGGELILEVLQQITNGSAKRTKQSEEGVTYAHKLTKDDELINWNQSARKIQCQIRALSPKPGAYFMYNNEIIKIIVAEYTNENVSAEPGIVIDDKLSIACAQGVLKPQLLQRQGRKMIYTEAFLRGFPIPKSTSVA